MHKFLAILTGLSLSLPVYSAGLGYNPFDRSSPTSANGPANKKPTPPVQPPVATPAPKPVAPPVAPAKQDNQTPKSSNTQNKK